MMHSYLYTLASRAVVVTMDRSARNLHLVHADHWLSNPENCKALRLTSPAYVSPAAAAPKAPRPQEEVMMSWSPQELHDFLSEWDLLALAVQLQSQRVAGSDFVDLTRGRQSR